MRHCVSFFPDAASTKFQLSITQPDFGQHGVEDLFRSLGPVAIFSAKRHWTAPRLIQLQRGPDGEGFGFSVRGDAPVIIAAVDHNSLADVSVDTNIEYLFSRLVILIYSNWFLPSVGWHEGR